MIRSDAPISSAAKLDGRLIIAIDIGAMSDSRKYFIRQNENWARMIPAKYKQSSPYAGLFPL
ncbi:MAG: hypothetical protein J6A47_04850 [Bacilli bacterium]|nr:hypothetical protein [Bacilli bacterium]MBO6284756.1 hypothetical protein [Bacilli bacterium]